MHTLLVTGGAGFIGSNFVLRVLAEPSTRVVTLDKLTYAGNLANLAPVAEHPRHRFVRGDICDGDLVAQLLAEHAVDAVINFAAESHVDRSIDSAAEFVRTNVMGTQTLLDASRRHAKTHAGFRYLQVSTDEVFGSLGPTGAFSETTPFAPNSPYAASKAAADHLVRAAHHTHGLDTLTTHCSNNYGPLQFPEKLIPLMVLNALEYKALPVYGDGLNVRDWLYVGDHCEAILAVLSRGRSGETYNIGGGAERTNLEMVRAICDLVDEFAPGDRGSRRALITHVTDRPGHDRRYAIDASKIRAELGWTPAHAFEDGLRETVRWYLEHRAWCDDIHQRVYRRERVGLGGSEAPR
ncbi:MAG: dTDP-glucose 4,6-dehydratase [Polyangiales bacterium]